jgi:hypothetical protein
VDLNDALLALEHQAATVASFIDFDDADLVQLIADGWAPLPEGYHSSPQTRNRWRRQWIDWLRDAAMRWESRPMVTICQSAGSPLEP